MITFGRKLKYLRQKNHLTQKELGMAVGFPESCADIRIAQYESDARTPRENLYISDKLTILHGQSDHLSRRFRSLISERDSRRSKSFL